MKCDDVQIRITEMIDTGVSGSADVEAHVEQCDSCRLVRSAHQALHDRMLAAGRQIRSPRLADPVMMHIAAGSAVASVPATARFGRRLLAVAAVLALATLLGLIPWSRSGDRGAGVAFAQVTERVEQTQSVAFRLRMLVEGRPVMSGELVDTRDRLRIVEGDGRIGIADRLANRALVMDPALRTYRFVVPAPELPDVYSVLRRLQPIDSPPAVEPSHDDRLIAFRARALRIEALVSADARTRLPIRLEWAQETVLPDGRQARGTVIADEIEWDRPIDPARLDMTPPAGYTALPDALPSTPVGATVESDVSVEERVRRLVNLCVMYGNDHDACWPEGLTDVVLPSPHGLLVNPDRPELEVGYRYIKPSGRAMWETRDQRRVVVCEQFNEWPGSAVVGYSDSTAERIADRARFEELLADASRRAGRPGSPTRIENRINSIVYACIRYGDTHEGNWPDELSQVQPLIFPGLLKHPDRPGDEIGFEYIAPDGRAGWEPAAGKRLIVYERFNTWPGAITVGFTDGSTQIMTDQAGCDTLIRQARSRAREP